MTPLLALVACGEVPAKWTIAGAALVLIGLVLRYFVMPLVGGTPEVEEVPNPLKSEVRERAGCPAMMAAQPRVASSDTVRDAAFARLSRGT